MLFRHFFQHFRSRLIAAAGALLAFQSQLAVKYFADLLGRPEVELLAGQGKNFLFQFVLTVFQFRAQFLQAGSIDRHPVFLHFEQGGDQRPVIMFINGRHPLLRQPRTQHLVQPEDNVSLFAGVSGGNFRFQIAGTYLLPADAEKLVGVGHFHPEKKV